MSYLVVIGNSFPIKDELKTRFKFKFDFTQKVWFRTCEQDKYWYWQQTVEGLSKDISCCWVSNLSKVPELVHTIREESPVVEPPHEMDGRIFEMSAWYAKAFKETHNTEYQFRNLKIHKVIRETAKAYQVDAEFFSGIASSCGVCGLVLSNDISRATGIGPVCAERLKLGRPTMANAKEIVRKLELMSQAQGQFKGVWIPKSQIRKTSHPRGIFSDLAESVED